MENQLSGAGLDGQHLKQDRDISNCADVAHPIFESSALGEIKSSLIDISQSLHKMSDSSLSESAVKLAVISALSGAIAAFIFNLIQWRITKGRERREALEKGILDQLSRLCVDLTTYWMRDQEPEKSANAISEMNIKSDLKTLDRLIKLYYASFPYFLVPKSRGEVELLYSDLFDVATGEDFESQNRTASPKIARQVSSKLADIRIRIVSGA